MCNIKCKGRCFTTVPFCRIKHENDIRFVYEINTALESRSDANLMLHCNFCSIITGTYRWKETVKVSIKVHALGLHLISAQFQRATRRFLISQ